MIFHNPYPPSSDIGFHGSIINLILDNGTLPEWNPYHMGGEQLATPIGFHFFVSTLILLSGMPLILAELVTALFYSSIVVFPAYIVAKRIWKNPNTGYIAAFFASISALSFEMISWGGYTNVVALSLIIIIFYVFLRNNDNPTKKHLIIGAILSGAMILTHTFSLSVFAPILAVYLVFLIIGKLCRLKQMQIQNMLRFFVTTIAAGALLVSPWILRVIDFYIGASSEGALTGGLDNKSIILANRTVEPVILTLIVVVVPALLMLRYSRKRWLDKSSLFLFAWFLVPVVMTQAYLFGIYTDYSRFMYFIDFPGIIIIAAGLMYLNRYTTLAINWCPKIKWQKIKKILPTLVFVASIFIFIMASLWSIFPDDAMYRAEYYTSITQDEATTLHWVHNNTPEGSVLVSDHLLGWWLGGISKRPTLSAASLEFLVYSHEIEVAQAAQLILDTNYQLNNEFIQINEDGPYEARHNPEFSYEKWAGESFGLLYFDNNLTTICYNQQNVTLAELKVTQHTLTYNETIAVLTTTYENQNFTVTKTLQLQKGAKYADLIYDVQSNTVDVFDFWINMNATTDRPLVINMTELAKIGVFNWFEQVGGQVALEPTPDLIVDYFENTTYCQILYTTQNSGISVKMQVSIFDLENKYYYEDVFIPFINNATNGLLTIEDSEEDVTVWTYTDMLEEFDVSYVVCRDQEVYMKFAQDNHYRLVMNSGHVAVFEFTK